MMFFRSIYAVFVYPYYLSLYKIVNSFCHAFVILQLDYDEQEYLLA